MSYNHDHSMHFPAFIYDPSGIITVSNGDITVNFDSLKEFLLEEPDYMLPEGVVGLNYEFRDDKVAFNHYIHKGGKVTERGLRVDTEYEGYINKVEVYNKNKLIRAESARNARSYAEKRAEEYSPVGDQLDQIIKTFKHLKANGVDVGTDAEELISMSDKVKSDIPK